MLPSNTNSGMSSPSKRSRDLRVAAMVLILLNLVLGASLLLATRNDANRAIGFSNCCRGDGPEAYCCYRCCWFAPSCETDSVCQDI